VEERPTSREEYIEKALSAYRRTPERRARSAARIAFWRRNLHERGGALMAVENALVLAAARRMIRPPFPPLGTIRSLAYFIPVIEEVLSLSVQSGYFSICAIRSNASPQRHSRLPPAPTQPRLAARLRRGR